MSGPQDPPLLSIVVPAYNEVRRITQTLRSMQAYLDGKGLSYEIIVSADGTDGTREAVEALAASDSRISVIGSAERRGKGRGVREGVLRARGKYIGNVDADYKTEIDQVERLMPFLEDGYEVVVGSRRMGESQIKKHQAMYRRVGSKVFAWVMRALVGLYGINDTQCGFKFYSRRAAYQLFSKQKIDGYMFDVEILRLAKVAGMQIKEVGVRWADDGDTRYNPFFGTIRNGRELLKIRFMRYGSSRTVVELPAVATPALGGPALAGAGTGDVVH